MKFNISALAIKNPIPIIVLFFLLSFLGISSFNRLPINADPNVSFPAVSVTITQAGASASELENSVTRIVENALSGMANLRHITSSINEGSSVTIAEFALKTNTDRAVNDVRNMISQIRADLPSNIDAPIIERLDSEGGAILYYAINSPNLNQSELVYFVDNEVTRRLLSLSGVQQVKRLSGARREIHILLDPLKLYKYNLSATYIQEQVAKINTNAAAGKISTDNQERQIRVLGSAKSLDELKKLSISLPNNSSIALSQIADIIDTHAPFKSKAMLNSKEIIAFSVFRSRGSSDTLVAKNVEEAINNINKEFKDIKITQIDSKVDNTKENYDIAISTLLEGIILTIFVVFLFLRDFRATFIAGMSLILSILPVFLVMELLGFTLNSISLLALTLVIGILVDDAVVEIENTHRHLMLGKRPYQAAIDASGAIGFAVIAISLSIVAVFMPVSFISGVVGEYFVQFGVTVSVAVLSSLLVARLFTPLLAAYILRPNTRKKQSFNKISLAYERLLRTAIKFKYLSMSLAILLFIISIILAGFLPTGFSAKADSNNVGLDISLVPSNTLDESIAYLKQIDKSIRNHKEVSHVFISIGEPNLQKASVLIRLKPHKERSISQKEFENKLANDLRAFSDIRFSFSNEFAQRDVSILLQANDHVLLEKTAFELKKQMQEIKGIENVQVNLPLSKTELQVKLKDNEAAKRGVNTDSIAQVLKIATIGDVGANAPKFNLIDRQIPIRIMLQDAAKNNPAILGLLRVDSTNSNTTQLSNVASIHYGQSALSIDRFDKERRVLVEADLLHGFAVGEILEQIRALDIMQNLPNGIKSPKYGDEEYINEMFEKFSLAMGYGVMMVFLVLVILFKDFLQALTILIAMPLSIGGAVLGLLAFGAALDLSAVIGILMLMGIVSKNSILLVDFIIANRAVGTGRLKAIIESGKQRAKPIIMTTIAMIAGMAPAVFASGAAASFRAPMAVAVICGLLASTLLSLIFVPVVYLLMDNLKAYILPRLAKLTSVTKEDKQNTQI